MMPTLAEALGKLAGRALSSVEFGTDSVLLCFDGPCMTAYTPPTFAWGSESLSSGQPGYREGLCKQIGCRVKRSEVENQRVSIVFESGATVSISLRDDDYRGPEALQFWLDHNVCIWVV
jgi:hypothetical protein